MTALMLAFGLFLLSVSLHLLHWLITGGATDYFGIVVNFLGIVAGILLGLNLLVQRSRSKKNIAI